MASLLRGLKQNDSDTGYYMPLSSLQNNVFAFTNGTGAGGSWAQGSFSTASWATLSYPGATNGNPYLSSINGAGAGILKDMGRTVVSSGRTFRKVQLVAPLLSTTNGVAGQNPGTNPVQDYLTGYIELGFDGNGRAAPVAVFGR